MIVDLALMIALLSLLGLSAFFSGSETALFALGSSERHLIRKRQDLPSRRVALHLDRLQEVLATILLGNTLVNILMAVLATRLFIRHLGPRQGALAGTIAVTLTVLVFGEVLPKTLAVLRPRAFSLRIARPLLMFRRFLDPLSTRLESASLAVRAALVRRLPADPPEVQEEDLLALMRMAVEEGSLGEKEFELVRGVFELEDTPVEDTMIPRVDLFLLEDTMSVRAALPAIREAGFRHVPLYREQPDRVTGILLATDLLGHESSEEALSRFARPARFCPESQSAGSLLVELLEEGESQALVIDEYGALSGLASLEDLFEVLVGEIFSRRDYESQRFFMPDENTFIVSARMELPRARELTGLKLAGRDVETLGGYLLDSLGEVPEVGESHILESYRWTLMDAKGPSLKTLKLERVS